MTLLNCEECDEVSLNEKYIETKPSPELRKVFLEIDWGKFRDAFVWLNREDRYLPNQMGYVYLDEKPHRRAFHIRVDNESTKEAGETVFYKVPILDDFYKKLVWVRPTKYRNCKIMPLGYSRKLINKD